MDADYPSMGVNVPRRITRTDLYAVSAQLPYGYGVGLSYNVPANRAYTSAGAEAMDRDMLLPTGISDPYLALIDHAMTASVGLPVAGGTFTVGTVLGRSTGDRWDNPFIQQSALADLADTAVNVAYALGIGQHASVTFEGGELIEAHGLLGSDGADLAGLAGATTFHGRIVGQWSVSPRVTLSAGFHLGETEDHGTAGLVDNISDVVTTSGGIGATIGDAILHGDRLGISAGLPLAAQSGNATLTLPAAEASDGTSIYQTITSPVRATAQEIDFQGSWMEPPDAVSRVGLAATVRANPDNVSGVAPEGIIAARYSTRF